MLSKPQEEHLKSPPWNINVRQVDGQQVEERSNGANEGTWTNTDAQLDGNPSTFVLIESMMYSICI